MRGTPRGEELVLTTLCPLISDVTSLQISKTTTVHDISRRNGGECVGLISAEIAERPLSKQKSGSSGQLALRDSRGVRAGLDLRPECGVTGYERMGRDKQGSSWFLCHDRHILLRFSECVEFTLKLVNWSFRNVSNAILSCD